MTSSNLQPIAADDVSDIMTEMALAEPVNGVVEIGGLERAPLSEFVARYLKATNDLRTINAAKETQYFGVDVDDLSLVPGEGARIGPTRFDDWLDQHAR